MSERPVGADLTVAELGEFGLIDRLARILDRSGRDPLQPEADGAIGIGDDAALWEPRPGFREVLTTDALIEGVHFRHSTTSWIDLGWKALAENVSDIAAMGARPTRAFVTLGLRPDTRVSDLEDLYRGMAELAAAYRFGIAGGDTVSSPVTMLSITVIGELEGEGLRRAAGRPGDLLVVTGPLGGSAGGLALLEQGLESSDDPDARALIELHRRPYPRVQEGWILAQKGVRCGMDLSDGLLGDAGKLAYASGLSAVIDLHLLPTPPALVRRFGEDAARMMALAGGEDYELLIAISPGSKAAIQRQLSHGGIFMPTVVGRLKAGPPGQVTVLDEHGQPVTPPKTSWDHFRAEGRRP
jgi:thiamine-monophosphate kinase